MSLPVLHLSKVVRSVHQGTRSVTYLNNPVVKSRDPCENRRLAVVVTSKRGAKTDNTMNFPLAVNFAVEWTA